MVKKYKLNTGMGVGVSSVLMIFVALALTIFATLSYLSARADIKLTEKSANSIKAYYKADLEAEKILGSLSNSLTDSQNQVELNTTEINYTNMEDILYIDYSIKIDELRTLFVELEYKDNTLYKNKWEVNTPQQGITIDMPLNLL